MGEASTHSHTSVATSPDSEVIALGAPSDFKMLPWEWAGQTREQHSDVARSVAFSPECLITNTAVRRDRQFPKRGRLATCNNHPGAALPPNISARHGPHVLKLGRRETCTRHLRLQPPSSTSRLVTTATSQARGHAPSITLIQYHSASRLPPL